MLDFELILYKLTNNKKIHSWKIKGMHYASKKQYHVKILTGIDKLKEYDFIYDTGKNIGRSNETSYFEQAKIIMNTKINKKRDEGYNEIVKDTKNPLPMLALEFSKRKHDITYPCFVQPKLDGVRAIYNKHTGFYSRKGKSYTTLHHIHDELDNKIYTNNPDIGMGIFLDGELYSDELTFQELVGLIRKEKLTTQDLINIKKIHYAVFDIISDNDFEKRLEFIKKNCLGLKNTRVVKTIIVNNEMEINDLHKKFIDEKYEGVMIRNFKGKYDINHRSKNLQKLKLSMVEEFEIVGAERGTGTEEDCVIWIVKTNKGDIFKVRPLGSFEDRKKLYRKHKTFAGKLLSVKFQEYTDGGIPRFPVGIEIRNYE